MTLHKKTFDLCYRLEPLIRYSASPNIGSNYQQLVVDSVGKLKYYVPTGNCNRRQAREH